MRPINLYLASSTTPNAKPCRGIKTTQPQINEGKTMSEYKNTDLSNIKKYAVVGDFSRMTYSTHKTWRAAENAAKKLNKKWGGASQHSGSEATVREI